MNKSDIDWAEVANTLRGLAHTLGAGSAPWQALNHASMQCELRAGAAELEPTLTAHYPRVAVESPFRADTEALYLRNTCYADAAMLDSLERNESPFLGHLLYPRVLDDTKPADRQRGINAHLSWLRSAERVAVYVDFGVTSGMRAAIQYANDLHIPVVERSLPQWQSWTKARPTPGFIRSPRTVAAALLKKESDPHE